MHSHSTPEVAVLSTFILFCENAVLASNLVHETTFKISPLLEPVVYLSLLASLSDSSRQRMSSTLTVHEKVRQLISLSFA